MVALIIAGGALAVLIVAGLFVEYRDVHDAPFGFEDDGGFHFGDGGV